MLNASFPDIQCLRETSGTQFPLISVYSKATYEATLGKFLYLNGHIVNILGFGGLCSLWCNYSILLFIVWKQLQIKNKE